MRVPTEKIKTAEHSAAAAACHTCVGACELPSVHLSWSHPRMMFSILWSFTLIFTYCGVSLNRRWRYGGGITVVESESLTCCEKFCIGSVFAVSIESPFDTLSFSTHVRECFCQMTSSGSAMDSAGVDSSGREGGCCRNRVRAITAKTSA